MVINGACADSYADGSLTLQRRRGSGMVHVPAEYVREHVELAYASTAHRAQGRTVDTAHAMVGPTTTREVLYVSATRGKEANRLYVDTHYDPDPQTSHDDALEPMTPSDVLVGVLRNEGAEVAAHEMIRREHHESEGMERLSAEYLTLATEAQAERFDALLARSGLSDDDLAAVAASAARGPLFAGLRDAEARGLDVEAALPKLVAGKSLADAADVASVLHGRVDRWSQAAGGRRRHTGQPDRWAHPESPGCDGSGDGPGAHREGPCHGTAGSVVGRKRRLRAETAGCGRSEIPRAGQPGGSAGCERCRRSRLTGTAGTSRVSAPSVQLRTAKTRNSRPSARGRWWRGSGRRRSVRARTPWVSRSLRAPR